MFTEVFLKICAGGLDTESAFCHRVHRMRYLPTLDLWAPGMTEALYSGALKLQRGQWVRCGQERPSRFVRANRWSIWAIHPQPGQARQFLSVCESFRRRAGL